MRILFLLLSFPLLSLSELRVRVSPEGDVSNANGSSNNGEEDEDTMDFMDEMEARKRQQEREWSVYSQVISGNSSQDTVTIEMEWADGTILTQLTDFRSQSQLLRVLMPGEEDLGQPNYQAFCFVSHFSGDLIPPEAVMKLRQKNPGTVRVADEDRGEVVQDSPLKLNRDRVSVVSPLTHSFCKDARDSILSSEHELFNILESAAGEDMNGESEEAVKVTDISHEAMKDSEHLPRCFAVDDRRHPCICSLRICIDWYPCALKYCRNKEGDGEHRCGIKTCKKCLTFRYPIKTKNLCMWDDV